jgi:hypothetical protein
MKSKNTPLIAMQSTKVHGPHSQQIAVLPTATQCTGMHEALKAKVHPITGHKGTEGEKRYSSTLSLPSILDGMGGQSHVPATLRPGTHSLAG